MNEAPKKHDINSLNVLSQEAEEADAEVFAEMRSNILLIAGDHYTKKTTSFLSRMRDTKQISDEQKIRLTKNHVQRIAKTYVNNIVSYCPGVAIEPKTQTDIQDEKTAQLCGSVWADAKQTHDLDQKIEEWADDFVGIGEVGTKIFWNPDGGKIKAYYEVPDPVTGQPQVDDQGQKVQGEPVFTGQLEFEDFYGFNLLRPKGCKNLDKAEWLGIRKMVSISEAMGWVRNDEEKQKFIQPEQDKTYIIFDAQAAGYASAKDQLLIKEYYFKPCMQYPKGWYYITTEHGVLFEGELPFGIFPIITQAFERVQTAPRGRSIVKVLRPYQIEINRAASKMAEHQITLGDDKVLVQKGSQLAHAGVLPGVRGVSYTGKEPTVLQGRSGDQYLAYMQAQIEEMYSVAMVAEDTAPADNNGQIDPYAMLFKSASQKKKFTRYTRRFEKFLIKVCQLYLELAQQYLPDDALIPAIGKREMVNIPEFRNANAMCYEIKMEAASDDIETKFGRMLSINHTLQYVGTQLSKQDIGKLIRANPYADEDEMTSDLTLDYDNAENDILALERGEKPVFSPGDNHPYVIQKLRSRQRQADYRFLHPTIQQNYDALIAQHEQVMAQQAAALQRAEAGFIPTDGYLATVQLYASDPADPEKKSHLVRLPYSSIVWLIKRLQDQGLGQDQLAGIDKGAQADIAGRLAAGNQPGMRPAMNGGPLPPQGAVNGSTTRNLVPTPGIQRPGLVQ